MLRSAILAACVLVGSPAFAADKWRVDGNNWRDSQNAISRVALMQGYVEGYSMAQAIAPFYTCLAIKESKDCLARSNEVVGQSMIDFAGLTFGQLRDGVDSFYADYRNRKIELPGAMNYVVKAIRGTPTAELEQMVERMREFATK